MKNQIENNRQPAKNSMSSRRWCQFVVLVFVYLVCGYALVSCSNSNNKIESNSTKSFPNNSLPANSETSETNTIKSLTNSLSNSQVLAKFTHTNQYHSQLPCLVCHRRDDNSPRISLPGKDGHTPCIGCHTQQFADNKSPICTICHTDAEKGTMKGFPSLRNFNVRFDHAQHLKQTNCTTCHKPSGAAMSIPTGANTHATCFQCHSANADSNLSSCSVCHQPGQKTGTRSESANIFAVFSHAKHKLDCTSCHNVKAGAPRGNQVTMPLASMHFAPKNSQSCGGCHNNQRAFGGTDFADCKRCHKGNNFKF